MSDLPSARPVTAVIVTYQSARTIGQTLVAVRRCHDEQLLDAIIVDNNSTDATRDILKQEAAWARLVFSDRNNGFGRGCNIGFSRVASPYTIFINPDAIVGPVAVRTMLRFLDQHPAAGIVGPAIHCGEFRGTTVLQHTGARATPWTILRDSMPFRRGRSSSVNIVPGTPPFRTGWVAGAVFMIRTDLLRRLGGFDRRFFLYWEETDVCKRAEDAGFETWAIGTALAHHVVGASSSRDTVRFGTANAKHYFQSRYYYMIKHHGWLAATIAEVGEFALLAMRSMVDVVRGRGPGRLCPRMQAALLSMPEPVEDER